MIPFGGLGEIGLNMMALEYDSFIIVVDAGLMFPEEYMPGVDVVIPDYQYLKENREKIQAIILTHGHEDHIGALPFLLKEFTVPVFGTNFTIELLKEKLKEHKLLDKVALSKIRAGESVEFGPFKVEFIQVNHSIVDGVGLAIETPEGIIIHSGDFKIDYEWLEGAATDVARFAYYGNKGVLALLSDSTNIEKEGFTLSEREVGKTLESIFQNSEGRIIAAVFASNIKRIQQIINLAVKFGRKVLFSGRSMITNVEIAKNEGFLSIPQQAILEEKGLVLLPDNKVTIITTGSQGEPMSSLTRMAYNRHKTVKIKEGDMVILSSRFIPGNERAITSIINNLYRMGASVIYEKVSDIHSSGHAYQGELKLMLSLVKPKYFIPIHGEYRHLVKHIQLAVDTGIGTDRTLLVENGTEICFDKGNAFIGNKVKAGRILVDGKGVGDVGEVILRDRIKLSEDGMVIALMAVDEHTGDIIYGPDIISRGFVFEDQSGFILEEAKCILLEVMDEIEKPARIDWAETGAEIKRRLKRFFFRVIERKPLILPIIIAV